MARPGLESGHSTVLKARRPLAPQSLAASMRLYGMRSIAEWTDTKMNGMLTYTKVRSTAKRL